MVGPDCPRVVKNGKSDAAQVGDNRRWSQNMCGMSAPINWTIKIGTITL